MLAGFFVLAALAGGITLPLNDLIARYSLRVFHPQSKLQEPKIISLRIDDKSLAAIPSTWLS